MKIKDIGVIMAVALAAGGCNQNDEGLQQEGRVPILLRASVDDAAKGLTRTATAKTTQDTELIEGESVDAYIKVSGGDWLDNGTKPLQYQVDGNSGNLEPVSSSEPARYYPVESPYQISVYAVHPSYTSGDSFSVATDQTDEGDYAASDLCYSKTADYGRQSGRQTLTFKHMLSKIVVNLTTNTGATLPTAIKLQAKKTTTMTYPTGSGDDCSVPAEATGDVATFTMGLTSDGTTSSGAIVIPPQTVSAGTSFISFTVDGVGPMYYPLPANTTFESGKRYTYNIKVNNTGITVTTDVNDWGTKVANETVMGKRLYNVVRNSINNPLYYVLEKDLNSTATALFTATNSGADIYLAQWPTMMTALVGSTTSLTGYNSTSTKTIDGIKLVVPTSQMWLGIVPSWYDVFTEGTSATDVTPCKGTEYGVWTEYPSCFKLAQSTIAYKSYWSSAIPGASIENVTRYAIRYIGTNYCSVWKYSLEGTAVNSASSDFRLVIRSQLINSKVYPGLTSDTSFGTSSNDQEILQYLIDKLEDGSFDWEDAAAYEERTLYAVGIGTIDGNNKRDYQGIYGDYAVATTGGDPRGTDYQWYNSVTFSDTGCRMGGGWGKQRRHFVRLFRDN